MDYKEKALKFAEEKTGYGGKGWLPSNDPLQRRSEVYLSYVTGYEEAINDASLLFKKLKEEIENWIVDKHD